MAHDIDVLVRDFAFGVVDAQQRSRIPANMPTAAMVPDRLGRSAHLMPTLVDLRCAQAEQLATLFASSGSSSAHGARQPVVAVMLKTSSDIEQVAQRWNAMQLQSPNQRTHVWLRIHDPRVLHQLFRILLPEQVRHLFGLAEAVTYWLGDAWVTQATTPMQLQPGEVRPYGGPQYWDWPRVERIGIVNRALQQAGVRDAAALGHKGAQIEAALDRAMSRHGLQANEDLVEFGTRALVCRAGFDDDPRIAGAIRISAGADCDSRLTDRLALVDPGVWDALRADA